MSNTPRTDAVLHRDLSGIRSWDRESTRLINALDLAGELERENSELIAALERINHVLVGGSPDLALDYVRQALAKVQS